MTSPPPSVDVTTPVLPLRQPPRRLLQPARRRRARAAPRARRPSNRAPPTSSCVRRSRRRQSACVIMTATPDSARRHHARAAALPTTAPAPPEPARRRRARAAPRARRPSDRAPPTSSCVRRSRRRKSACVIMTATLDSAGVITRSAVHAPPHWRSHAAEAETADRLRSRQSGRELGRRIRRSSEPRPCPEGDAAKRQRLPRSLAATASLGGEAAPARSPRAPCARVLSPQRPQKGPTVTVRASPDIYAPDFLVP